MPAAELFSALPPTELLPALLDLSVSGIVYYQPVRDEAGQVIDLAFDYLNPAAQRLLGLPAQPATTYRQQFPGSAAAGGWAFHREALLAEEPRQQTQEYCAGGYDNHCLVAARRVGPGLLVSFSEASEPAEASVGQALRQSRTREQQAQAELAQQRRELGAIFEQAPVAIAVFRGPAHVIELANDLHLALWGRTREQVLGRPLFEAIPEAVGIGYEELLAGVLTTGQPYVARELSAPLVRHGVLEQVYFDFVYQPLREADGQITGVVVVASDITGQVHARQQVQQLNQELETRVQERTQQLQEQQLLLSQILGQVPAAIATFSGPAHRFSFANTQYREMVANRAELGHAVAALQPEMTEQGYIAILDQVYATGEPLEGREQLVQVRASPAAQAQQHYVDFVCQPLRDSQGQTRGILIFAVDVTEKVLARRAAARQQQARQAELQHLFEQAPVGIYLMRGPGFVIELINDAAAEMWGTVPAAMLGRSWLDIAPGLAGSELLAAWQRLLQTGEPYYQHEVYYKLRRTERGKSDAGYFNVAYQPWRDEQGRIMGIIAVGIEVTEQVRARQQVQQLNQELQATNQELNTTNHQLTRTNTDLDTFVYTASHDLKAPITNIEGLLSALRDYLPPHADPGQMVPRLLGMMDDAVARFQQTISYLTDVSRLQDAEAAAGPAEAVALAPLVEGLRLDLGPLLATTHGQLLLDIEACTTVYFSPKNLRSILYNLLSNALKYRAPGRAPEVRLRAYCPAGQVVLEVQDNGLGLSAVQQAGLFKLFRRLHTHVEGSGVGLYMLKRIVENAGGTVAVRSEPGVGSTFTITLPHPPPASPAG